MTAYAAAEPCYKLSRLYCRRGLAHRSSVQTRGFVHRDCVLGSRRRIRSNPRIQIRFDLAKSRSRHLKPIAFLAILLIPLLGSCRAVEPASSLSPTPSPAISREKAIAIAATQLPPYLVEKSIVQADDIVGWRVSFQMVKATREELAWPDDGKNTFQADGSANVPPGIFATIVIIVSPSSGDIIDRIATNSILLGLVRPATKIVRTNWWNGWAYSR